MHMTKKFATAINCMDGRTQQSVIEYMKRTFSVDFVDMITEPGPNKILAEGKCINLIESLKKNAQPEYLVNPFLATVHNGNLYNCLELSKKTKRKTRTDCDVQWLLLLLADNLYKKEVTVDGKIIVGRPEERIKVKKRIWL